MADEDRAGQWGRVCIRAPNWVGDAVMATPALRTVRQSLPHAHIALVLRGKVEAVLRGAPWFDERIVYRPEGRCAPAEFLRCAGRLRKGRFDLGLLLPNSFSSALMFRLGGVGRRVGYIRDMRSALLTDPVPRPSEDGQFRPTYMVDYYLGLCERLGMNARNRRMELCFDEGDRRRARRIMREEGIEPTDRLFLLHPGAGYGPSKRWPNERWAELADALAAGFGAQVAVIAGPQERPNVEQILSAARPGLADLSSGGIDLHLLKPVVADGDLMVTTDSGPRHYGVALGVPTVCLMGPTDPGYSTSNLGNDHLVRIDVDCGPCQLKECPTDHRCMDEIEVEAVMDACEQALSVTKQDGRSR